jgi:DNA mismatch repair ATPase MutS
LAKIKLKLGENEIEVDSRDFYVDNQTLGEIIDSILQHLPESQAKIVYETVSVKPTEIEQPTQSGLESLDNAETYEPEFDEPKYITSHEIKSKLQILETSRFFDSPRTVTETVQQLREFGWAASQLDVSKALAKMASNKEIMKNSHENGIHYFVEESLVAN